ALTSRHVLYRSSRPRFRNARPGPLAFAYGSRRGSVAHVDPAESRDPAPTTRCDQHDAAETAPVAMAPVAVMAAPHSTTLAAATCRGCGRNECGASDSDYRRESENRLADHGSRSCFCGMCSHILPVSRANDPSGSTPPR